MIHKTFERVTKSDFTDELAVKFFLDELEKTAAPTEMLQKLRELGPHNLMIALNNFRVILHSGKAEVDLGPEKISIDGVPATGKIDHMSIDDQQKKIEIYDFKTGNYHKEKWQSHATLYKYMLQLEFYRLLLKNSPTYSKYKVEKAHILFVTPDKDDEVYDKVYEYTDESEQELIKLIHAVYDSVLSLNFLHDPELFIQSDNSLGIKDIKNFVSLLLAKNK